MRDTSALLDLVHNTDTVVGYLLTMFFGAAVCREFVCIYGSSQSINLTWELK